MPRKRTGRSVCGLYDITGSGQVADGGVEDTSRSPEDLCRRDVLARADRKISIGGHGNR